MKIIFFGTGTFAIPALERLRESVSLVVTQPDRPSGRGMKPQSSPVKVAAVHHGLFVETPERSRAPDFVDRLRGENADFLVVASYGQILSEAVLQSATQGGINLHGSILPKLRGAAPIQRAIEAGDAETGITLMQMDRGMDTGDIIAIAKTAIGEDETYGELQDRLAEIAAQLIVEWAPRIQKGDYPRTPQESARASLAPKIEAAETKLDLTDPAASEYNRFRALTPSPGASIPTRHGRLKLHQARRDERGGTPGEILALNPLTVACGKGSLAFLEVQAEGKRPMDGRSWANGHRLRIGDNLLA